MPMWPFNKSRGVNVPGPTPDNPPDSRCSFCGGPRAAVGPMVEGPGNVYICVACVRVAHEIAQGNRMQSPNTELDDPQVRRSGHMHILCYFRLERESEGNWRAVSDHPAGASGRGPSARDAVRALQSQVLARVAESFAAGGEAGDHFTNHADQRLR